MISARSNFITVKNAKILCMEFVGDRYFSFRNAISSRNNNVEAEEAKDAKVQSNLVD